LYPPGIDGFNHRAFFNLYMALDLAIPARKGFEVAGS